MNLQPSTAWRSTIALAALTASLPALGDLTIYEDGDDKVAIGARIQLQYLRLDPETGSAQDDVIFRRLRPYIEGTVTDNWLGKLQVDFGKAFEGDEVAIKDVYLRYSGWNNMQLFIGNTKTPFSREFLASSKRQQTVERGFVGNHNFGTPDRQVGFKLTGENQDKKITWAAAAGFEDHDPAAGRIDFDTPANQDSDWNEGVVLAGRVDFHPWGFQKFDQGDFNRNDDFTANFSLAAYTWSNDDDNNTFTDPLTGLSTSTSKADLDTANGVEISAGLRGRGFSVDTEYQIINADTVDGTFTGGVYRSGSTDLEKFNLEGGYMLAGNNVELVGRYEMQDADNYADTWSAFAVGVNYFWNKHKTKAQVVYRHGDNFNGVDGDELDSLFVQFQFVF